jgi:hypothetical protein
MLTAEDIDRMSSQTKDPFEESLHEHADLYPELEGITTNLNKPVMVRKAKQVVRDRNGEAGLLSAEAKANAIAELLEESPEAVLLPVRGGFIRLSHPELANESFQLSVFSDLSNTAVTQADLDERHQDVKTGGTDPIEQQEVSTTPLSEVPEWAYSQIYDLMDAGAIQIFKSHEKAQQEMNSNAQNDKDLLEGSSGFVSNEHFLNEDGTGGPEVLTQPVLDGERVEHNAANNVLNKQVNGENPLPEDPDKVDPDPSFASGEEVRHVANRIRRCLKDPNQWVQQQVSAEEFDFRHFFGHIVVLELEGRTPSRKVNEPNRNGGMRPRVLRKIREIASAQGFEVIGKTVRREPERPDMEEEVEDNLDTELMNPEVLEEGAPDEPSIEPLR